MAPIVKIQQGYLKGLSEVTSNGFKFTSFMGIPYAKPPTGSLRFQAPQPAEAWRGIRDASEEGQSCFCNDLIVMRFGGSENCLYLNVFTPKLPTIGSKPKAVMFWIHGGGYLMGSGSRECYGPEYLIERDIVLVSINYRLGILGFMNVEDQSLAPCNVGMRDIIFALKWVQQNIDNFGGDPNNVTIFGESAGSGAVQLLTFSPLARGLFHRAIMQSGSALGAWSYGQMNAVAVCSLLRKPAENEAEAFKILQAATVEELINAQNMGPDKFVPSNHRLIAPVVEGPVKDAFLPEHPEKVLASGTFHKVPMLIGYNSEEGLMVKELEITHKIELCPTNLEEYIPFTFGVELDSPKSKEISARIKEFYFGKEEPNKKNWNINYKIFSDTMFLHSTYKTIEQTVKHSNEKIFWYRLSLKCDLNQLAKTANMDDEGVTHAEDLFYLFKDSKKSPEREPGSIEHQAIERMTKWWSNFAKYGDPNGVESDPLLQPKWPNVEADKMQCFDINTTNSVLSAPEANNVKFWNSIEQYALE